MLARQRWPAIFLLLLAYGTSVGLQVADGLVHVREQLSGHTTDPHYEDPAEQSHAERCLLARPACTVQQVEVAGSVVRIQAAACQGDPAPASLLLPRPARSLPLSRAPPVTG